MQSDGFSNKAEAFEAFDDVPLSPENERTIGAVIARRYSRRDLLKGSLGVTAATALFGTAALTAMSGPAKAATAGFAFRELANGVDERDHVADGYQAEVLIRWGDPLFTGTSEFAPRTLTAAEQARRFGYNNDFIAFFPLEGSGTRALTPTRR
jgi:secreted PhoX family phosphatase